MNPNTLFALTPERLGFVLLTANLRENVERMAENAMQCAGGEPFHAWNRASDTSNEAFHAGNDPFDTWNATFLASDKTFDVWHEPFDALNTAF